MSSNLFNTYDGSADHTAPGSGQGSILRAVYLHPGSDASSVVVYDAASATGTVIARLTSDGTKDTATISMININRRVSLGIFADITGTGAKYTLIYE